MFIELVEALRCPARHDDTWLVATVDALEGRHIVRGSLGCPVCGARYAIAQGEVDMAPGHPRLEAPARQGAPGEEDLLRARALLDLVEPGGVVALSADAARLARSLEDGGLFTILLVNPAIADRGPDLSTVWVGDRLPLAPRSLRAAMLGDPASTADFTQSIVDALRPGGRIVAPASWPVPEGVIELARDDRHWVAEKASDRGSALLPLRRA